MMLPPRALYNDSPPERRSRISNNPTLLYSWWCTLFSAFIIGARLVGRYIRNERLFREDKIMALSLLFLFTRMGLVHVVLLFGTNNADVADLTDPVRLHRREIGAKVVLAARIFYALFIWTAKYTVSEFLKRITERFWKSGYDRGLRAIRGFLVVTLVAVLAATLAECHPFHRYWQVKPDPGPRCRQGYGHLFTMGVADIVTDILLVCFPIPIILGSGMHVKRKLSLVALFSMSVVLVAITAARIPKVVAKRGLQQYRTVFASSEILAATAVSNAIILGSFLRDRGVKKAKFRANSTNESLDHNRSSSRRHTLERRGSEEALARSLGYRTHPDDVDVEKVAVARPAQAINISLLSPPHHHVSLHDADARRCPPNGSAEAGQEGALGANDARFDDPLPSPRSFGRRVSFYDVGGLIHEHQSPKMARNDPAALQPDASRSRRASATPETAGTSLHSGHAPCKQRPPRSTSSAAETGPARQLQDVGGLLLAP